MEDADFLIRPAGPDDTRAIATVHVESWRGAYRGPISDPHLEALSIDRREAFWREVLAQPPEWRQRTWVATGHGRIVGFATAGKSRDDDVDATRVGELQAIYVRPDSWRRGLGRALLQEVERFLRDEGFLVSTVWVLEGNAAGRSFYAATGWRADGGAKHEVWDGIGMDEVRYRKMLTEVRPVAPPDGPSLGAIQVAVRPRLAIDFPEPHDPIARGDMWSAYLASPPLVDFRGWVAERKGEVVAFLISGRDDDSGTDVVTIFDLYVTPEHQGWGIGRQLLETSIEQLRHFGYIAAVLWTAVGNEGSRIFYEHLGWHVDDRRETEQGTLIRYRLRM